MKLKKNYNIFIPRNIKFLRNLKKDVERLPLKIWEYEDIENPNYHLKRKMLIGTVMHIDNKILSYVNSKYGNNELWSEFQSYSLIPQNGILYEPFHEENNRIWKKGRCSYLYFLDKLIDYAESEEFFNSFEWRKEQMRWCVLIIFAIVLTFLLFFTDIQIAAISINGIGLKIKILLFLSILMVTANLLWYKNWREILPISTSLIIALIGLLIE